MSWQFFRDLPGFLFMLLRFQFKAWFGIPQSSMKPATNVGGKMV